MTKLVSEWKVGIFVKYYAATSHEVSQ